MERISSRQTFFFKRVFPCIWFGIAAPGLIGSMFAQTTHEMRLRLLEYGAVFALVPPLALAAWVSWRFIDEVWDAGEFLVFKKGKRQVSVSLKGIANIDFSVSMRPAYVILILKEPCIFGGRIAFIPRDSWGVALPYEQCRVTADLKERILPNQSSDPAFASGTARAEHEPRHR